MTSVKKSIVTAVCIALCVVLPMAFHSIPNAGSIYCPMHLAPFICGLTCGWPFGLLCGIVGPLLSSLLTGMPPIAYLPAMMVEIGMYGLMCGLMMGLIRSGKVYVDLYVSLIVAMLGGRVVAGVVKALIFAPGKVTMASWVTGYFVTSLPGIIIQLVLVPSIILALMKANLVPVRYTTGKAKSAR